MAPLCKLLLVWSKCTDPFLQCCPAWGRGLSVCPSPPDSSALPPLTDIFAVLVITGAFDLQPEDVHLVTFCVTGKKMIPWKYLSWNKRAGGFSDLAFSLSSKKEQHKSSILMCNFQFHCWCVCGDIRESVQGGFTPYQVMLHCNQLIIMARLFWHIYPKEQALYLWISSNWEGHLWAFVLLGCWLIHKLQLVHSVWHHVEK